MTNHPDKGGDPQKKFLEVRCATTSGAPSTNKQRRINRANTDAIGKKHLEIRHDSASSRRSIYDITNAIEGVTVTRIDQ